MGAAPISNAELLRTFSKVPDGDNRSFLCLEAMQQSPKHVQHGPLDIGQVSLNLNDFVDRRNAELGNCLYVNAFVIRRLVTSTSS